MHQDATDMEAQSILAGDGQGIQSALDNHTSLEKTLQRPVQLLSMCVSIWADEEKKDCYRLDVKLTFSFVTLNVTCVTLNVII